QSRALQRVRQPPGRLLLHGHIQQPRKWTLRRALVGSRGLRVGLCRAGHRRLEYRLEWLLRRWARALRQRHTHGPGGGSLARGRLRRTAQGYEVPLELDLSHRDLSARSQYRLRRQPVRAPYAERWTELGG